MLRGVSAGLWSDGDDGPSNVKRRRLLEGQGEDSIAAYGREATSVSKTDVNTELAWSV